MKRFLLTLLAAAVLPAASYAQPSGRDLRKAERIAEKDKDFTELSDQEQKIVLAAIAKKVREVRQYNWKHVFTSRKKVSKADVSVYLADTDLDALKAKYQKALKGQKIVSASENAAPAPPDTVTREPEKVEYMEVHGDPFHGLFEDNQWELLKDSDDAKDLVEQIEDALAQAGEGGRIVGLTIRSSASTLTNTGKAADKSWLQLSDARAKAALVFILESLKSKEVVLDVDQVTIDPKGENGDGTSGPKAPVVNGVQIGGNGSGEPAYKDRADYDQHKYVDVVFLVEKKLVTPGRTDVVKKDGEESSRLVALDIDTKTKTWLRFKKKTHIRMGHRHTKRSHGKGKYQRIPCPEF
ncbi:MAG: hypothetical protein HY927_09935 [Elusimicrobia bacterium]|nr:hypothetical protein [Elusimicrobiota bacterium]